MMYGPVVVGGHNWLKLKAVRITVNLKDEVSGKFRFDWRDPEHYTEGVHPVFLCYYSPYNSKTHRLSFLL
jgi:hypothetical protein